MFDARLGTLSLSLSQAFIVATFLALLTLSLLGFHPSLATHLAPPSVPFSDKVLHFVCFFAATALFYACWVVEESARRVTFWRYWNELVTVAGFTLVGGIGSEFIQALLPYKTFQVGDVVANVLGSALAVAAMHHYSREARRAAELRRLYVHLDQMPDDDDEEDDDDDQEGAVEGAADYEASEAAEQGRLIRQHRDMQESRRGTAGKVRFARIEDPAATASGRPFGSGSGSGPGTSASARRKQALDPWSATEDEIFGLGDDDDDDDIGAATASSSSRREHNGSRSIDGPL